MKQIKFESYSEYKKAQISANKRKLDRHAVLDGEIPFIKDNIAFMNINVKKILCHGVRNGFEVKEFIKAYPKASVLGTDISPTAKQFDRVIEWDFHNYKLAWVNEFDIIYSNALDHAHNPNECLKNWIMCLSPNGVLVLNWSKFHDDKHVKGADCFGANFYEYIDMIKANGGTIEVTHEYEWINLIFCKRKIILDV